MNPLEKINDIFVLLLKMVDEIDLIWQNAISLLVKDPLTTYTYTFKRY
jgi:hypothetical protein